MFNIDNSNMVSVSEFGEIFGYSCETDVKSTMVTLSYDGCDYVFTHDSPVCKKYANDSSKKDIGITKKALMLSNGKMYVSVSGLKHIFMFESVTMENGILSIKTNGVITAK